MVIEVLLNFSLSLIVLLSFLFRYLLSLALRKVKPSQKAGLLLPDLLIMTLFEDNSLLDIKSELFFTVSTYSTLIYVFIFLKLYQFLHGIFNAFLWHHTSKASILTTLAISIVQVSVLYKVHKTYYKCFFDDQTYCVSRKKIFPFVPGLFSLRYLLYIVSVCLLPSLVILLFR